MWGVRAPQTMGVSPGKMRAAIGPRRASTSNRQSAGTFGGAAVMGALSALIVTTCVGPALVGALLVISESGQVSRGGAALFAMSVGMGTPLLVVGASAGRLLPRAGPWMDLVKKLFGVMMLAVAAWMLARIVPERVALSLWAVPALILAWLLWSRSEEHTSELQSQSNLVCRLLLEKKKEKQVEKETRALEEDSYAFTPLCL